MKSTGIVRKIDELGRIVLPMEIRKTMELNSRDAIEIFVENDKIILKKYLPACLFCGSTDDIVFYKGKLICSGCLDNLRDLAK